jgi:murein DD-endopeptidase MepM/ murein hydrolase activator NlpD
MAAGDGVVLRAGTYGAYGKLVEIRHPNGVITRYGHLKGFASGLRPGREVEQGVCIGYVGATGLATGPHLHFEFRVNGIAVDPARVESSEEDSPSAPADMVGFQREVARLKTLLAPASSFALGA